MSVTTANMTDAQVAYQGAMDKDKYMLKLLQEHSDVISEFPSVRPSMPDGLSCILEQHGFLLNITQGDPKISGDIHPLFRYDNWSDCLSIS